MSHPQTLQIKFSNQCLKNSLTMWLFVVNTHKRSKCSKTWNTFLFLVSNKIFVIRVGINRMLVRLANGEDPDQTAF